jgi:hypothetical protein
MQTIRELLASLENDTPLAESGRSTRVYALCEPGLEDYVVKVTNAEHFARALKSSTSLTPSERLIVGREMGQEMMVLNTADPEVKVSILRRQPGTSLYDMKRQLQEKGSLTEAEANLAVMKKIRGTSRKANPFLPVMENAYATAYSGNNADLNHHNVLLDEARGVPLGLVDQYDPLKTFDPRQPQHSAERELNVAAGMLRDEFRSSDSGALGEEYKDAFRHTSRLIREARHAVIARHRAHPELPKGLEFADVRDVKGVSLDRNPMALAQTLSELDRRAGLPAAGIA